MNKNADKALVGWKPIEHRTITAKFQTQHSRLTIIQARAPPEEATTEEKDAESCKKLMRNYSVPSYHVKLLLCDFNAQVHGDR